MADSVQKVAWFYKGVKFQQSGSETFNWAFDTSRAILAVIGLVVVVFSLASVTRFFFSTFVLPGKSLSSFGKPSETYAVITGASDGLGKEFALQLARRGFNTLLVSRTQSKLDAVAKEIESKYPKTTVHTLSIDFTNPNPKDYQRLASTVASLNKDGNQTGILINNVGLSHSIPVSFAETPEAELEDIIKVNCFATLKVTQIVLPYLTARKKGLILTMGSFAGLLPTPLLGTYSGSKAFLQNWSAALASELAPHGITVELVQSYLITTAMSKIRRTSAMIPNPRNYVKSVLGKIGRTGGAQGFAYTSTPFWSHAVLQYAMRVVPIGVLVWYNRVMHQSIRSRALKRKAKAQ